MKISRKQLLDLLAALFAVIVFAFSGMSIAFAGTGSVTMTLPINLQYGAGGLNPYKSYKLVFQAEDSSAPMPQEAENGAYTLSVSKDNGVNYSIKIDYQSPGDYWYEINFQDARGNKLAHDWLHVQVFWSEKDGDQLNVSATLRKNSKSSDKIPVFSVEDPEQPSITSTPTPTISNTPGITPTVTTTPTATPTATPTVSETPKVSDTPTTSITPTTTVTASTTPASSVIPTIPGGNNNNSGGKSNSNSTNSKVSTGKVSTGDTANTRIWQVCLGISVALLVLFLSATVRNNRKRS